MTISTKYDLHQRVWCRHKGKIRELTIVSVSTASWMSTYSGLITSINYSLEEETGTNDEYIFLPERFACMARYVIKNLNK